MVASQPGRLLVNLLYAPHGGQPPLDSRFSIVIAAASSACATQSTNISYLFVGWLSGTLFAGSSIHTMNLLWKTRLLEFGEAEMVKEV